MTTDNLESLVHRGVRRSRNILVTVGIVGLVLFLGLAAAGKWAPDDAFGPDHVHRMRVAAVITGGILTVISLVVLVQGIRMWNPAQTPIARLVVDRPADIRWIYVEEFASKAYGITVKRTRNIKIGDAAGKLHGLMTRGTEVDAVLAMLAARAPQARQGYDDAARKAFKALKRQAA
jgi:hypothetical protein